MRLTLGMMSRNRVRGYGRVGARKTSDCALSDEAIKGQRMTVKLPWELKTVYLALLWDNGLAEEEEEDEEMTEARQDRLRVSGYIHVPTAARYGLTHTTNLAFGRSHSGNDKGGIPQVHGHATSIVYTPKRYLAYVAPSPLSTAHPWRSIAQLLDSRNS